MKTVHRRRARWLPLAAALLWLPQAAGASVPATLGFEGRLETLAGGPVADGDYTLTFALYGDDKTATASWTETATVKVAAGRFSHALGSVQALAPATLDATGAGWVGVRVGQDPELPRSPLRAVAFAARAALAEGLACSGCVGVGALKFDGDIDLGGNSLKAKNASFSGDVVAKTVTATSLVGDGSKLTGVQIAGGSCKSGEVVTGVKADGSVICAAAPATTIAGGKCQAGQVVTEVKADGSVVCGAVQAALPPDGLSAISNGLLTNVFDETFAGPELPKAIPDNNPSGVLSEIVIGDIGTLQGITVSVDIETSDLSGLAVTLFDPDNNVYKLHDKSGTGTALKTTFPTLTKTVSGDLTQWVGKNPKGTWRLIVADWKATAGGNDGQLKGWSLGLKVLSSMKVGLGGNLQIGADPTSCWLVPSADGIADSWLIKCGNGKTGARLAYANKVRFGPYHGRVCTLKGMPGTIECANSGSGAFYPLGHALQFEAFDTASAREEICGVGVDGSIACTGNFAPLSIVGANAKQIAVGDCGFCFIDQQSKLKCKFGAPSTDGLCSAPYLDPLKNYPSGAFSEVHISGYCGAARSTTGATVKWGYSGCGAKAPVEPKMVTHVFDLQFSGIRQDGSIFAYAPGTPPSPDPQDPFIKVEGNGYFGCSLSKSGQLMCWGSYNAGTYPGQYRAFSIANSYYMCAVAMSGKLSCWGSKNGSPFIYP